MFDAKIFLLDLAVSYSEFNFRSRHSKKDNIVLTESLLGISNIFIPLSLHSYSQSWQSPLQYFVSQRISWLLPRPLKENIVKHKVNVGPYKVIIESKRDAC